MATETTAQQVGVEDVSGVRSRIAWGAILGGAVLAVAVYLVLTFFFAAVGLSLTEAGVRTEDGLKGAAAAAIVTVFVALFAGGWVAAQLTAGETQREAVLYGVLTWAVVTGISLAAVGMGVRAGYFAVVGGTLMAQNSDAGRQNLEANLKGLGVKPETIERVKADLSPENLKAQANDPANQDAARRTSIGVAWVAFAGTLLSICAGVAGAVVGSGPQFRLFPVAAASRQTVILAR